MDTLGVVFDLARTLLDDRESDWATDDYLRPFVSLAARMLSAELAAYRFSFAETEAVLANLPVGTNNLGAFLASDGPLANLLQPLALWERPTGGDDSQWTRLARVEQLTPQPPAASFHFWEFREGNIYLSPTSIPIDLRIRFEETLNALGDSAQRLRIPGSASILAYHAAALVARSRGARDLALDLSSLAQRHLDDWRLREGKELQNIRYRQQRF